MSEVAMLRTSERMSFKRCRQAWDWNFNARLKAIESGPALRFGDLVHQALAKHYKQGRKRGPHPAKTFRKLYLAQVEEVGPMRIRGDEKWEEAEDLGVAMLEGYVEKYGARDEGFEVISSEQTFQFLISGTTSTGKPIEVVYVGTFDGVWRDLSDQNIWFKEFKTAAAIDLSPLPMDEQAGSYWTFGPDWLREQGLLKPKDDLSGIIYTFLRKQMPDKRDRNEAGQYLNQDGSVSAKQPAPYFERQPVYRDEYDRELMRQRILDEAFEMKMCRDGRLPIYKNPGPLYMPNCRGCFARDMCELHETGNDWEAMRDGTMTTWDPYAAHEIIERH